MQTRTKVEDFELFYLNMEAYWICGIKREEEKKKFKLVPLEDMYP